MTRIHIWKVAKWDSGFWGSGVKGVSLEMFLQALERDGWEIFQVCPSDRSLDIKVVCRREE